MNTKTFVLVYMEAMWRLHEYLFTNMTANSSHEYWPYEYAFKYSFLPFTQTLLSVFICSIFEVFAQVAGFKRLSIGCAFSLIWRKLEAKTKKKYLLLTENISV